MHVVHPPHRHNRRRPPVRLFREPDARSPYDIAADRQARSMNRVALQIVAGLPGSLLLIQCYAWLTGAPGIGVMSGGH